MSSDAPPALPETVDVVKLDAVEQEPKSSSVKQPTRTVRLRGLPFASTEDDIRTFFAGYELTSVFICKRNGRSTGEAYVQLDTVENAAAAMAALQKQNMGHRYIEMFESTEADLTTARAMGVDRLRGFVVRMRGLPFNASASDVLRFFEGVEVVRGMEGVVFTHTQDGRPTGEAYVEVQDEEGQKAAMRKHKEVLGSRYIELFVSTKADMIQAIQHNRMILGYANRKRYVGGGGGGGPMGGMGPGGGGQMGHGGGFGGGGGWPNQRYDGGGGNYQMGGGGGMQGYQQQMMGGNGMRGGYLGGSGGPQHLQHMGGGHPGMGGMHMQQQQQQHRMQGGGGGYRSGGMSGIDDVTGMLSGFNLGGNMQHMMGMGQQGGYHMGGHPQQHMELSFGGRGGGGGGGRGRSNAPGGGRGSGYLGATAATSSGVGGAVGAVGSGVAGVVGGAREQLGGGGRGSGAAGRIQPVQQSGGQAATTQSFVPTAQQQVQQQAAAAAAQQQQAQQQQAQQQQAYVFQQTSPQHQHQQQQQPSQQQGYGFQGSQYETGWNQQLGNISSPSTAAASGAQNYLAQGVAPASGYAFTSMPGGNTYDQAYPSSHLHTFDVPVQLGGLQNVDLPGSAAHDLMLSATGHAGSPLAGFQS